MRPSSNNRRGKWGDPAHASSVVKALAEAGRANSPGRSIKRMLQLRYTAHLIRIGGTRGCRAATGYGYGEDRTSVEGIVESRRWDHRSTGDGMESKD